MRVKCGVCHGQGQYPAQGYGYGTVPCHMCFGAGSFEDPRITLSSFVLPEPVYPEPENNPSIELGQD